MTSKIPAKIMLKSTTKMSLSDRFTQYQKMRPQPSTVAGIIERMTSAQQVNRRLVQQLANRPSLQAAPGKLNMSVKQRLGPSNVKARLYFNGMRGGAGQRGGLRRGSDQRGGLGRGDPFRRGGDRQSGFMGSPNTGVARGGRFESPNGDFCVKRGLKRGGIARSGRSAFGEDRRDRGANRLRGGGYDSFQRGGRGWERGLRRGRGEKLPISKEQLDNQLDEYMSNKRANLDQEMFAYMAQNDS